VQFGITVMKTLFSAILTLFSGACFSQCEVFGEEQSNPYLFSVNCAPEIEIPTVVHVLYHDTVAHSFIPTNEVVEAVDSLRSDMAEADIGIDLVDVVYHDLDGYNDYLDGTICFPGSYWSMPPFVTQIQWNPEWYMNVYVAPYMCGGTLGFAFLSPNGWDGVWVRSDAFGFNEERNLPLRNENKTLTHEVGHYCGLRHVFQGVSYCGEDLGPCNQSGDYVCDTPPTKINWSCENPICPPGLYNYTPDNHMDYYVDSCRHHFTNGQIERMTLWMNVVRSSIISCDCIADLNDDGVVATGDMLMLLAAFGTENSSVNLVEDDFITIADFQYFLSKYGNFCD